MSQLQPTQIANALAGARTPRERRRLVIQLADEKGVSAQSIYNAAKRGGFISGRSKRADAGKRELPITDEQLSAVAKIIHASHTEKGRIPMPAHEAIRLAECQGIISPGTVSEAYLCQWMRKRRISKKDAVARTPHTRLMSNYPNHVHMIDASQCAQWFLSDTGAVAHQRRGMEVYKNKSGDSRKITRLLLIDHYSGAFFVWYVQSETALDWIDFLYLAWGDKANLADRLAPHINTEGLNELFPFRGLPDMVYADNGSPIKAEITRHVLDKLDITFDTHKPYNPRAKGANETMQRHWERWFESRLKITPANSIDQLNAWAFECCMSINANRKFTRHGQTRFAMWASKVEQIRDVPDYQFYRTFAMSDPETRRVAMDGTIRYKPRTGALPFETSGIYRVPDVNLRGGEVEVSFCLYEYPRVKIVSRRTGQYFEATPLARNDAGFLPEISATIGENFKQPASTDIQKAFTELEALEPVALDKVHTNKLEAPAPAEPLNIVPFIAADEEEVRTYTRIRAKRLLLEKLGAAHSDELHPVQQQILNTLPDLITQDELNALQAQLTQVDYSANIIPMEGAN